MVNQDINKLSKSFSGKCLVGLLSPRSTLWYFYYLMIPCLVIPIYFNRKDHIAFLYKAGLHQNYKQIKEKKLAIFQSQLVYRGMDHAL